jgi:3-oxoadipate enol-lactonase
VPIVTANGIELYYEEQGDGPSLVFAHGVGGNHASWYQQVPFFARWYRVITFDHRGFGNSTSSPEGVDRSSFVGDLEALLDALGIDETALVAQSMGGWTMAGFTLRHPGRVRALVMADTLGGITQAGPLADRLADLGRATRDLPQLERVLAPQFPRQNPAKAELYLQLASFNVANRFNLRGNSGSTPSPADMEKLDVPILFLVGQEDVLYPPDVIRSVHEAIPHSKLVVVPDAGHSVYFESPDVFNHEVLGFLRSCGYTGKSTD